MLRKIALLSSAVLSFAFAAGAQAAAAVQTEHVRTELIAYAPNGIVPGKEFMLGLEIVHQPQWHTYWKNPGDSGLATTLSWTLPEGFTAGDILWPTPKQLPLGPLMNFGYDGVTVLPVAIKVPQGFHDPALRVRLHAQWLVCREICLPEAGDYVLELTAGLPSVTRRKAFEGALLARPQTDARVMAAARIDGDALAYTLSGLPPGLQGKPVLHFPEDAGVFEHAAPFTQRWDGERLLLRVPLALQRSESPAVIHSVIAGGAGGASYSIAAPVEGGWGARRVPAASADGGGASGSRPAGGPSFLPALALAFVAGALLNLMPCVFPVLALKMVGFAKQGGDRRRVIGAAIAYSAGVLGAFLGLAAVLLLLRGAGAQLGWGFQLQSPTVVAALIILFSLIGLNLAGLFEMGSLVPGSVAGFHARHPLVDDVLSGILAVAIASPCTGPFMGAAVGAALTQSPAMALSIFAALGMGMAAPYLAASMWPPFARALPKPGLWMVRFKVIAAFPMFATVVWLLWVLGQQVGIDGVAGMLAVLVALAFSAWALSTPASPKARRMLVGGAAIVLAAVVAWALPMSGAATGDGAPIQADASAAWQPWSPAAVQAALARGRPVFIDFTAAWCVTCQFNKRTVLADPSLRRAFAARGVLLLRADWTRRNAGITAQLALFGRSGVPVYALYGGADQQPQLLSELLTVDEVRSALQKH